MLTGSIAHSRREQGQKPMMKHVSPFVVLAGLFFPALAQAQPSCSNRSLQGDYAFKAQGEVVGTLDTAGVHPFPAPQPINSIAQVTFYGNGTLERLDFTVANGAPQVAQPPNNGPDGFRINQTGT